MLDFNTVQLSDENWAKECFSNANSFNCEYAFGSVYLWRSAYRTKIAHYKDFLICRWGKDDDILYSLPIGKGDFKDAVLAIIDDAKGLGIVPRIYGITKHYKPLIEEYFKDDFSFSVDDANFDYIYDLEKMANLSGKKYHSKRNHISNFKKNYTDWKYEDLNEDNIPECITLHKEWIEDKDKNDVDYSFEFEAVLTGFEDFEKLGLKGGLIRADGKVIAYTYGEKLSDECFVTHFEKAFGDMQGGYPIINQEFSKKLLENGFKLVNREEDLGLEGLRKAKQSYHPEIWLEKETATYLK